jgi:hypothetical protein
MGRVPVPAIQQERILQHAWHLKKNGYRESTITGRVKLLRSLARRVDLFDPEGVKGTIALLNVSEGRKEMLAYSYLGFCRQFNLPYTPPRYQRIEQLPFIPLEIHTSRNPSRHSRNYQESSICSAFFLSTSIM